ncbi:MAG: cyclic nucleotide-binding domain-containing protein [Desulfotalea sp.]
MVTKENIQVVFGILNALNDAIVACRLYGLSAARTKTILHRSYGMLFSYLQDNDMYFVTYEGQQAKINEYQLTAQNLNEFDNLIVFKSLESLSLDCLSFDKTMVEGEFNKVINLFTVSKTKIAREGGVISLINRIGVGKYFLKNIGNSKTSHSPQSTGISTKVEEKVSSVTSEDVFGVLSRSNKPDLERRVSLILATRDHSEELISAGIAKILIGLIQEGIVAQDPRFSVLMDRAESIVSSAQVASHCDYIIGKILSNPQATRLSIFFLAQDMSTTFGQGLYNSLIKLMGNEGLKALVEFYKDYIRKLSDSGDDRWQKALVTTILGKLTTSNRVKAILSQGKIHQDLAKAERNRQIARVERSIGEVINHNYSGLSNNEFWSFLPKLLKDFYQSSDSRCKDFLNSIVKDQANLKSEHIEKLGPVLLSFAEIVIEANDKVLLDLIVDLLKNVLHRDGLPGNLYKDILAFIYGTMNRLYMLKHYRQADKLLLFFDKFRTEQTLEQEGLGDLAAEIQDSNIDKNLIDDMIVRFFDDSTDGCVLNFLTKQGPIVTSHIVQGLVPYAEDKDLESIIHVLSYNSEYAAVVALEKLRDDLPWVGKRNLLRLIKEIGDESIAKDLLNYLKHPDLRVQAECLTCIAEISGDTNREDLLIEALVKSSSKVCMQVVRLLSKYGSEKSGKALSVKLSGLISKGVEKDKELIVFILKALSNFHYQFVIDSLLEVPLDVESNKNAISDQSIISLLNKLIIHLKKNVNVQVKEEALVQTDDIVDTTITGLKLEKQMRSMFSESNDVKAGEIFIKLIRELSNKGKYNDAEDIRAWVIDNHSILLTEIINAAEIIEESKAGAIDTQHIRIWSSLYDLLSTDEFSSLYHRLTHTVLKDGQVIVSQGKSQKALFFINSGEVRLYYSVNGSDVLIKVLGPGSVIGASAFFDSSVWTFSASCIGRTEISILKFKDISELAEDYPSLESRLQDFCYKFEKLEKYFLKSSKDRRIYQRKSVSGKMIVKLIDGRGKLTGTLPRGSLSDISEGGVSLIIRLSKKEHAHVLLGRKVGVPLSLTEKGGMTKMRSGQILGVRTIHGIENEYSVHIKYDKPINESEFNKVYNELKT